MGTSQCPQNPALYIGGCTCPQHLYSPEKQAHSSSHILNFIKNIRTLPEICQQLSFSCDGTNPADEHVTLCVLRSLISQVMTKEDLLFKIVQCTMKSQFKSNDWRMMMLANLVCGIDVGADSGAAGLQDIRGAERSRRHASTLQPRVLLQIWKFKSPLGVHC